MLKNFDGSEDRLKNLILNMGIKKKLYLFVLIPVLIVSISLTIVAIYITENSLVENIQTQLELSVQGYSDDVSAFKEKDIDITVFEGDTRVKSSIPNAVGTKASPEVIEKVLNKNEKYFNSNTNVNGAPYYAYYQPTENGMLFAGKPQSVVDNVIRSLCFNIFIAAFLITLGLSVVAYFLARSIAGRLLKAYEAVTTIADGDLTYSVKAGNGNDEIDKTRNAVKTLSENFRGILKETSNTSQNIFTAVSELKATSSSTLSASAEIARAIEDVATNSTKQAGIVSDVSNNIQTMQESVKGIHESISDIEKCSTSLTDNCNTMREKVEDTQELGSKLSSGVLNIEEKITATNEVIQKMSEILDVINDVATQTKLLSLNASIEAARAGESGRGFVVVAESIRTLSDTTATELVNINDIIKNITSDFAECKKCITEVVESNSKSSRSISEVIESFKLVDEAIRETSERVIVVSEEEERISSQMYNISSSVDVLGDSSQDNAAASEEVNASIEELTALMSEVSSSTGKLADDAENLNQNIKAFKI